MKIKLKDLTIEQYGKWFNKQACGVAFCNGCPLCYVECNYLDSDCWFYHKDLYSDKFLNREIEIKNEDKSILTQQEIRYLTNVIEPFRNRIKHISKVVDDLKQEEKLVVILINFDGSELRGIFPNFESNKYFCGMEIDKNYTLEELGL